MARGDPLFWKYSLSAALEAHERKAKEGVENYHADDLLNANPEGLADSLEQEFRVNVPVLKEDAIQTGQKEVQVDISRDPSRHIRDRSRPFYIKGTEITFYVPYEGDSELFEGRPNTHNLNPPCAVVKAAEITLPYVGVQLDPEAVKREFERDLASIREYLGWVVSQATRFNESLKPKLREWIAKRREKLLRDKGMVAALGYPMRRRVDAPQTYVVPTVRKKPIVARAAPSTKPFVPEPTLDVAEYERILTVISNMVHVIERSPQAFRGMKEEDLRQHFLVQLNGQYEGQATGETFNFEGKTDILIRAEGRNIFIAECKFWRGPESLREAIDQLLGYTSWRDSKTALLVFNRDKNFSAVLAKIPEVVKGHPNFKRQSDYKSETGLRFVFHHRDDKERELILTILAFEVPA